MKHALFFLFSFLMLYSCAEKTGTQKVAESSAIKTQDVSYNLEGKNYRSFVAYPTGAEKPLPVVMVLPEWWGVTEYAKERAKKLAKLGYFAMAVDYYGDQLTVTDPAEAQKLATPFYEIPVKARRTFDVAKSQLMNFPEADYDKIAVIGYCFGGAQALNMARQERDLNGAVSFHGNLSTGVRAKVSNVPVLVCHGAADMYVPAEEVAAFKKEMDSAKIKYTFIDYPAAQHSFTNPEASDLGKKLGMKIGYNQAADEKSWKDMQAFLTNVFK